MSIFRYGRFIYITDVKWGSCDGVNKGLILTSDRLHVRVLSMYLTRDEIAIDYHKRGYWTFGDGSVAIHQTATPEWRWFRWDDYKLGYRLWGTTRKVPAHLRNTGLYHRI
jgi:hypothetical protein